LQSRARIGQALLLKNESEMTFNDAAIGKVTLIMPSFDRCMEVTFNSRRIKCENANCSGVSMQSGAHGKA